MELPSEKFRFPAGKQLKFYFILLIF